MGKLCSKASALLLQLACGVAATFLLMGCVNTRDGVVQSSANKSALIVTDSDESNDRKRAKLRVELAIGYFEAGQATVALDEIKQALAIDPDVADAYNLRGLVYMRLDNPELAEDSFRRALALDPREPNALHNYGWLLCQLDRFADAQQQFSAALAAPHYSDRAKTLMTQGLCQLKAGRGVEAEHSLMQAYQLDASNPVVGYNLAAILGQRNEWQQAQFYIRRVNNSPDASAETLWLGIKIERRLNNREAVEQLAGQLQRRYSQSREAIAYEHGNFNE